MAMSWENSHKSRECQRGIPNYYIWEAYCMKRTLRLLILFVLVLVVGVAAAAPTVGACFTKDGDPVACADSTPWYELW